MLLANVAQLVEQFTRNEQVAGSNPAISSKKSRRTMSARFFVSKPKRSEVWHLIKGISLCISSGVYACISSRLCRA